jgi:hypothetical protein
MIVPRHRFTLISGEECLTEYTFDSGVAKHLFCKHCGIKSFYIIGSDTIPKAELKGIRTSSPVTPKQLLKNKASETNYGHQLSFAEKKIPLYDGL